MNILFIGSVDISKNTGDAVHVLELVRNLEKQGNVVNLVAKASNNRTTLKRFYNTGTLLKNNIFSEIAYWLVTVSKGMLYIFKNAKYNDVIYVRDILAGTMAIIPKIIFNKVMIYEINGVCDDPRVSSSNKKNRIFLAVLKMAECVTVKISDFFIAVTESLRSYLVQTYHVESKRIAVVNNGVNITMFRPMNKEKCRQFIKIDVNSKIICFVGALQPWREMGYILNAMPFVTERIPEAVFMVVGDGICRKDMEEIVEKKGLRDEVLFIGEVPYEEVPFYVNASDICVIPGVVKHPRLKITGASSLKLYEYLACGKPAIIGDVEGESDLIRNSNSGIVISQETVESWGKAIVSLLRDKRLRKEMGERGREAVVNAHSWESVARKIVEICETVIGKERIESYSRIRHL